MSIGKNERNLNGARMGDQILLLSDVWEEVIAISVDGAACCMVNGALIFIAEYKTETAVKPVDGVRYWRQLS